MIAVDHPRGQQGMQPLLGGRLALAFVGVIVAGAFAGLLLEGAADLRSVMEAFDGYLLRLARFTLVQAALSTGLSVLPALAVARALYRHPHFAGRGFILRLFAVPLALPAIVAAMGVLSLYGRAGYLAPALSRLVDGEWPGIYGLSGILVAHVFFNLPLATRLLAAALDTVPEDDRRLASQLGMGAGPCFRLIEWPVLRAALPGVAGLVFMLCVTSFTIVLTLGGGPAASTLEVGIYQALRFDFDPPRAVALTCAQIGLTAVMLALLAKAGTDMTGEANLGVARSGGLSPKGAERLVNAACILAGLLFVTGPIVAVAIAGLEADLWRLVREASFLRATGTSLVLASLSAALAAAMAWSLASARWTLAARRGARAWDGGAARRVTEWLLDGGASFVLVIPPIVIGAGWFILLRRVIDVVAIAPAMVVAVNAMMAMPFALRAVRPAHDAAAARNDRLCRALGIAGWDRLRLVDWPALRPALATAFAFSAALSLGDLGVIALFGSDSMKTLPYLLYERMGSYRTADAAGLALLLGALCMGLIVVAESFGRRGGE